MQITIDIPENRLASFFDLLHAFRANAKAIDEEPMFSDDIPEEHRAMLLERLAEFDPTTAIPLKELKARMAKDRQLRG